MIDHIRSFGFKGFDFDEDVPNKVVYTGPNTSGKSARSGIIALTLHGYIPFSTAGKRPSDILDSFGGESVTTAVSIKGTEFARKFSRNDKGVVSQAFQVNKKKVTSENFIILLNKAGAPKIVDFAEFMKQSDAKKVDTLFELYPNPDLENIDSDIEKEKENVSFWQKKKDGAESVVQRLISSKNLIAAPPGSISEIQTLIINTDIKIAELQEEIKQAEIEGAKAKAVEQEKREEAERKKAAMIQPEIQNIQKKEVSPVSISENMDKKNTNTENDGNIPFQNRCVSVPIQKKPDPDQFGPAYYSIRRIIDAMTSTGCETCAALIVAKQELKRYGGKP